MTRAELKRLILHLPLSCPVHADNDFSVWKINAACCSALSNSVLIKATLSFFNNIKELGLSH